MSKPIFGLHWFANGLHHLCFGQGLRFSGPNICGWGYVGYESKSGGTRGIETYAYIQLSETLQKLNLPGPSLSRRINSEVVTKNRDV